MSVIISTSVDAWVDNQHDNANHGKAARLFLSNASGTERVAYIFFPRPFERGAQVETATLRLYLSGSWSGSRTLTAKRIVQSWKENQIDWSNRPNTTDTNDVDLVVASGAEGDEIEFDVAAMLQDVSDGGDWFGIRLTISTTGIHALHSSDAALATNRPTLEVEWSEAPYAPTNLAPSGAESISASKPRVTWRFRDRLGDGEQAHSQIQIDTTEDMASPVYDTGQAANVDHYWETTTTGAVTNWSGITDGTAVFWRVRVWDEEGNVSDWSDVVEMTRTTHGTLTITNPAADPNDFVEETTPPISWTFTGRTQERVRVTLEVVNSKGVWRELWQMPWTVMTTTSKHIPKDLLKSGKTYRVTVEVRDTFDRQSVAGDLARVVAVRTFTYERSGTPSAVATLTAVVDGHKVTLTWTRATQPDYFSIRVDGEELMQRVNPTDVFVSGTTYSMEWWRAIPGTDHTYEVEAVVNDAGKLKHSDGNATDDATTIPFGIWLVDDITDVYDPLVVFLENQDAAGLSIGETGETFSLPGSRKPVRITDSIRGYEGEIEGAVATDAERDDLLQLKGRQLEVRLIIASLNIPVELGELTVTPTPEPDYRWMVSVPVSQVGEFFELDE